MSYFSAQHLRFLFFSPSTSTWLFLCTYQYDCFFAHTNMIVSLHIPTWLLLCTYQHNCFFAHTNMIASLHIPTWLLLCTHQHDCFFARTNMTVSWAHITDDPGSLLFLRYPSSSTSKWLASQWHSYLPPPVCALCPNFSYHTDTKQLSCYFWSVFFFVLLSRVVFLCSLRKGYLPKDWTAACFLFIRFHLNLKNSRFYQLFLPFLSFLVSQNLTPLSTFISRTSFTAVFISLIFFFL